MIENVLSQIDGIGIYGVISICIFFTVFVAAIVWTLGLGASHLRSMSAKPLDDGSAANEPSSNPCHE